MHIFSGIQWCELKYDSARDTAYVGANNCLTFLRPRFYNGNTNDLMALSTVNIRNDSSYHMQLWTLRQIHSSLPPSLQPSPSRLWSRCWKESFSSIFYVTLCPLGQAQGQEKSMNSETYTHFYKLFVLLFRRRGHSPTAQFSVAAEKAGTALDQQI